jgi:hypothetical protein
MIVGVNKEHVLTPEERKVEAERLSKLLQDNSILRIGASMGLIPTRRKSANR